MIKQFSLSLLCASLFCTSVVASAKPTVVGLGIGVSDPAYKGYSANYYPLPQISFDNGVLFVENLRAGLYAFNQDNHSITVGINYLPLSFKPSKTDNSQLKQLNKRKATVLGEVRYSTQGQWGVFSASAGFDILNESKSVVLNASYAYNYRLSTDFIVTPQVGLSWMNNKHNDYYYGVSKAEAARSGLPYYQAKSSYLPFGSITATYFVSPQIQLYAGVRLDLLTGDAKDSPMIGHDMISSFYTGFSYRF